MSAKRQSAPAISVMTRKKALEAQRDGSTIEHFGLIPGTFVPPTGSNLPSWRTAFKARREIEWWRFWNNYMDWVKCLWMAKYMLRPKLNLELAKVPEIARKLYIDMYTHFARGDLDAVQDNLSPGLRASLAARISERGPQTQLRWEWVQNLSRPQVVFHQVLLTSTTAPKDEQMGLQQAVVRIHSKQRLMKVMKVSRKSPSTGRKEARELFVDSAGREIAEDELEDERKRSTKETVEYVVVRRHIKHSKPGPWVLWGTTEETTASKLQQVKKDLQDAAVMSSTGPAKR